MKNVFLVLGFVISLSFSLFFIYFIFLRSYSYVQKGKNVLKGQIFLNRNVLLLPSKEGKYIYIINVIKGNLEFYQFKYNPDPASWSSSTQNSDIKHFDMNENNIYYIEVEVINRYEQPDIIKLMNKSFFSSALFHYDTILLNEQ